MQGFVSNKDSEEEGKGDPLEALLYAVFVATSERASVAELAGILSVEVPKLQMAISIACRLGFGTRLTPPHQGRLTAHVCTNSLAYQHQGKKCTSTHTSLMSSSHVLHDTQAVQLANLRRVSKLEWLHTHDGLHGAEINLKVCPTPRYTCDCDQLHDNGQNCCR